MSSQSDLTTKAAEIRAGLEGVVERHAAATPATMDCRAWHDIGLLLALIEQQAAELADEIGARETAERGGELILADLEKAKAELAEARREKEAAISVAEMNATSGAFWAERGRTAESECAELLREKERMGDAHQKWWKERGGIGMACFGSGHDQERAFAKTDKEFAFAVANALSAQENGPAGLAGAHSKSPDIASQSERIAVLEAVLRPFAKAAEHDIGSTETDADIFQQMGQYNRAPKITVGDMRRARSALAPLGEE